MYARVTKLYFGGMARHLADEAHAPAGCAVGIRRRRSSLLPADYDTHRPLLADIAQALGYEVVRIDLFRTRLATATREQLREEVVVLRWNGGS